MNVIIIQKPSKFSKIHKKSEKPSKLKCIIKNKASITSSGKKFMLLGADINLSAFGQQRIESGSSFYVACAGWSEINLV